MGSIYTSLIIMKVHLCEFNVFRETYWFGGVNHAEMVIYRELEIEMPKYKKKQKPMNMAR